MRNAMKKRMALPAVLLAAALAAGACSGSAPGAGGGHANESPGNPSGETKEVVKISIMTEFHTTEPPAPDNPVTLEFEKRTNTDLDIMWTSPNNFEEKFNVTLASGDIPDLMKIQDLTNPLFQEMVKQGAFWDLTPFIGDYPNLMDYPEQTWESTKIDGKNYVIPSVRPLEGASFAAVRKDWLDKLGLPVPETMEDMYEVMRAFTYDDPDGNGKDDTIGYSARYFDWVYHVFNYSNGRWKAEDGKLIDTNLEPETRDAILWIKRLYDEKLMPADFAVMERSQAEELTKGGIAGVSADTVEGMYRSTAEAAKLDPKADFMALNWIRSPNGKEFVPQSQGFSGVYVIPKTVSEEKVKRILELMDYGASEEGFELACYGFEGVHFTVEDGFKVATEQALKDSVSQSSFGKIFERYDPYLWAYRTGMPKETFERNKAIIDERMKVSVPIPTIGLVSETYSKVGLDYDKKIDDLKVKIIMGKEPIEAWDRYVETLKSDAEYQKIVEEMNAAYAARQ